MIRFIRTDSKNEDFELLVTNLDTDLKERDGDDHTFYHQFNSIDTIKYAVVGYSNDIAVGCGALKEHNGNAMEVKRMYVSQNYRGQGIATKILNELELWAYELNYKVCILETGKRQPEAIALYIKNGYEVISNYGQYTKIENSVCFQKNVSF